MDFTHQQEASSSCSTSNSRSEEPHPSVPGTSTETKVLRSSARVKAAKQKEKERASAEQQQPSASASSLKRPRESSQGKGKEVADANIRASKRARRATYPDTTPLTINEPVKDIKGKKRAAPESPSDEEHTPTSSSAPVKRPRTTISSYSLRSRTEAKLPSGMPKKTTRASSGKGKVTAKSKAMAAAAGSSRAEEDDITMGAVECSPEEIEHTNEKQEGVDESNENEDGLDDGDEGDEDGAPGGGHGPGIGGGMDDSAAAMSIFGDFRQLGSYMMGVSTRLKTMLNNIKPTADPTTRLVTLQELSELLSISTEDTLAGSFQVEAYIRELVKILGGTGGETDGDEDDQPEQDEDAALAAALAMSSGGTYQGDENLEAQVLACRCLANLMEALPGVAHTVVYHGAIPVLCSKLIEISYIDLAEQTLSTLEKISEEFPSSIVREGGLAALLNYLDFFSLPVQRTALQAASNCCRNVSTDHFAMISGVWPIIRNCLGYSDQRIVEYACLCVIRVIDAYHRASATSLEALVDLDLINAINLLLLPSGGSPLIAANTFTLLLHALATSARVSPKITIVLLEAGITDTLYQILTGVLPPSSDGAEEQGDAVGGQGLGGGLADMAVMENLAHRPKDQVEEALSLISELMPPMPKDGVFDHKAYTEKSLARLTKARSKADRAAARQAAAVSAGLSLLPAPATAVDQGSVPVLPLSEDSPAADVVDPQPQPESEEGTSAPSQKEPALDRTDLLRSKPEVVNRFLHLIVPILVDVYAASVSSPVRLKTMSGLLKAVSFLDGEELKQVFSFVPVASFASSILSSNDHPTLVIGALQLVELLLSKVPAEYKPVFRREGVFHEVEILAARSVAVPKSKDKDKDKDKDSSNAPSPSESATPMHMPISTSLAATIPGYKRLASLAMEPDDIVTMRARVVRFKYLLGDDYEESNDILEILRPLVARISDSAASEKELTVALNELATLFASPHTAVSSFELLQGGVVDGLLQFATDNERAVSLSRRQELFFNAFGSRKKGSIGSQTPLAIFVKKLQESLTRMESFEVITVAQGIDDSKRSSPSLLARQLRLRLVATEESDVPRNLSNIVVSIHAIATFQALHDYLRPRVSGLLSSSSRLSGMLAALAASGLAPLPGSSTEEISQPSRGPIDRSAPSADATRRRSLRLSARNVGADTATLTKPLATHEDAASSIEAPSSSAGSEPTDAPSTFATEPAPSETVVNDEEYAADFTDDEVDVDAEVFDEEGDPDNSASEKTIMVSIGEDGDKVEAQTPDGTRVATPNPNRSLLAGLTRTGTTTRASYAAALKAKPTDWHLEFIMDDQTLPLDLTIYGAIHQHELRKKSGPVVPLSMIWQGIYTVKFKKVSGPPPPPSRGEDIGSRSRSPGPTLSSLPEDAPHAKILRLLRVIHKLNTAENERPIAPSSKHALPESAFVNNKLTAKLTRQLEEPMIVASSCLPDWALDLPQHFPFLFPFATRYSFLQSTSFGYARLILKWQSQQTRGQDSSRRDDGVGFLGRLQRQKVRISRKHILESAVKVFELYGSSSSILEVEYFEEVGTGLGPTLEFYSLVSKEFARRDLKLWRDADPTLPSPYVHHPAGLFPAPISPEDIASDGGQKRTHMFQVIGQFVAKAMLDSRIIDLSFNKIFLKVVTGEDVPLTIDTLKRVDEELAASLAKLRSLTSQSPEDKLRRKLAAVEDLDVKVEDLALDFTIPGYDIELRPGGRNIPVTSDNVDEYIQEIVNAIIGHGAELQAKAFREGFSKVFPITDLQAFTSDELVMLFGNSDEDWSIETLSEALKADHGFNVESRAIRDLIEVMSEYDVSTRRSYLQFITGSPKLPIGGFRGLNPPLTVVRKPHEAPLTADDYLPSVMTCVNYLKLPEYTSKSVLREKLQIAIREGVGSFHLS